MPEHFPQPQIERLEPEVDFTTAQKEIGLALLKADEARGVLGGAMQAVEALPSGTQGKSALLVDMQSLLRKLDHEERGLEGLLQQAQDAITT